MSTPKFPTPLPFEAQECANCYYARQVNKFMPSKTGTSQQLVYCHYAAPSGPERMSIGGIADPVAPVRSDAWCGQWRIHPHFEALYRQEQRETLYGEEIANG